jgi:ubiquinone biosynthesis protein UbiJ
MEFISPDTAGKAADLVLRVSESSPVELAKSVLQGDKPAIRIEGDVQLAAEVNWLIDHVRWDPEEDLARLIGDAPAHTLAQTAKRAVEALRGFVAQQKSKAAP